MQLLLNKGEVTDVVASHGECKVCGEYGPAMMTTWPPREPGGPKQIVILCRKHWNEDYEKRKAEGNGE